MSQKPLNPVVCSTTQIVGNIYRAALKPLIEDLAKEMQALIAAKKHFVVYQRTETDYAPNAKYVQATLRFHYQRVETKAWMDWRKNPAGFAEEPERYSDPVNASALIVIDGLPGGTITITNTFALVNHLDKTGVKLQSTMFDFNLAEGSRHLETTEKFLLSHTLSAAKAKAIKTLVEED